MMIRFGVLFVVVGAWAGGAAAQPGPPLAPGPVRPTFSPYLNLLRTDVAPAVNYYGIVRPQLATQGALLAVRQQVYSLQSATATDPQLPAERPALPITGQPVVFLETGGYFLNHRAGGGPAAGPTARPAAPPRTPMRGR